MNYTNSQILAAVLAEWARPAIAQIAAGNLMKLPFMQSLQATIGSLGLVSGDYSLQGDLQPMITPVVNALIQPMLSRYIGNLPDESIPQVAHDVVESVRYKGPVSILEGAVTFDEEDLDELADLLQKNLPVNTETQAYQVVH